MIDKHEGRVPCAHCSNALAESPCPWCGHMICGACGGGIERCPFPAPRRLAIPAGGRALGVDREGRRLLWVDGRGYCSCLALERSLELPSPRLASTAMWRLQQGDPRPALCVLAPGQVVQARRERRYFNLLTRLQVRLVSPGGSERKFVRPISSNHTPWVFASDGERRVFVHWGHSLEAVDPARPPGRHPQLLVKTPRFMTAGAASDALGVVAVADGRMVLPYDLRSKGLLGSLVLGGPVAWLGLCGSALVVLTRQGGEGGQLLRLPYEGGPPPKEGSWPRSCEQGLTACDVAGPTHADATADGRLVAARAGEGEVAVLDGATLREQRLRVGEDAVDLVRFVDGDRGLVTVTARGQVVVWHVRDGRVVDDTAAAAAAG